MSDVIVTKYYFQDVYTEKSDLWQMRNRTWPKKKEKEKRKDWKKDFLVEKYTQDFFRNYKILDKVYAKCI